MGPDELRIAYAGPALSGRSMNLQYVYARTAPERRGPMESRAGDEQRRMWFHLQSATLNQHFVLATAPGSLYTPHVTEELLRFADGIIFVADSQRVRLEANVECLSQVERLARPGVPIVLQWNKRDLNEIVPVDELEATLNPFRLPSFEAIAAVGTGVFATLRRCAELTIGAASGR